jgi:broad specificity phosphatase PhoE
MPADRIHLIRHGEVHNPGGVLYGRLPEFRLSERGHQMAELAAKDLIEQERKIGAIYSSPLLRTRESAGHVQQAFSLTPTPDERLIEPFNIFEGRKLSAGHILIRPHLYFHLRKPSQPSWGEPFESIAARMLDAMQDAWQNTQVGDAVLVSHQLPIVTVHRKLAGLKLPHNPKQRRCGLSSITSFERRGEAFVEVDYRDPAAKLGAIDRGAV